MKLSIVIVFWDKDYKKAERAYTQIKERVNFKDYEIITIDNREETNEKLIFEPTFSFGYNARQLAARKKSLEFVKGEYIWFVDADDEVLGLDEFDYTEDCVIFDALYCRKNGYSSVLRKFNEKTIFELSKNNKAKINAIDENNILVLWNKIIKADKLKEVYSILPDDKKIIYFEDSFVCLCLDEICEEKIIVNKCIYKYNIGYAGDNCIRNIEHFKNLFTGYLDMKKIIEEKKPNLLIWFYNNEYWLLEKLFNTKNKELRDECIKLIEGLVSDDKLKSFKEQVQEAEKNTKKFFINVEHNFFSNGISIVSVLNDNNDYDEFINNVLKNFYINKKELEIIIVDKRKSKTPLKEYSYVKIVDNFSLDYVAKKIVWFINENSLLYTINYNEVLQKINKNADIITFGYLDKNLKLLHYPREQIKTNQISIEEYVNLYGKTIHNKWFSKEYLLNFFSEIDSDYIMQKSYESNGNVIFIDDILYYNKL